MSALRASQGPVSWTQKTHCPGDNVATGAHLGSKREEQKKRERIDYLGDQSRGSFLSLRLSLEGKRYIDVIVSRVTSWLTSHQLGGVGVGGTTTAASFSPLPAPDAGVHIRRGRLRPQPPSLVLTVVPACLHPVPLPMGTKVPSAQGHPCAPLP